MPDRPSIDVERIWNDMRERAAQAEHNDYKVQVMAMIWAYLTQLGEQGFEIVRVHGEDPVVTLQREMQQHD